MTAIRSERLGADWIGPKKNGPEAFAPDRALANDRGELDAAAVTAFEGEIREFVRRDVSFLRKPRQENGQSPDPVTELVAESNGEPVSENLNSLIRRVSGASMDEIDRVILELQAVRDLLRSEGDRVTREISGYASLSHAATTSMKVIADSLAQWRSGPTNFSRTLS
jgi:hypothetical protein